MSSTDKELPVTVYSPESGVQKLGPLILDTVKSLGDSWGLGWRLFRRNMKAMYRQSLLGLVWAFIPPLMTTLVWVFLNGQRIINIEDPGVPYPAFVLTSTLLWSMFAQSLIMPNQAVTSGKSILVKINFNMESLLVAGFLQVAFDFCIKLVLIAGVFIVFRIPPSLTMLLAPFGVFALVLLGTSLGLLVLPVGMLYQDVQRLLTSFLPFWMLLTPVIYPAPREGFATLLNTYNPVSPVLILTRDWLFGSAQVATGGFWLILGVTIVLTFIGLILYRLAIPFIIERSGS